MCACVMKFFGQCVVRLLFMPLISRLQGAESCRYRSSGF